MATTLAIIDSSAEQASTILNISSPPPCDDCDGSTSSSGSSGVHNSLIGLQGGNSAERYHTSKALNDALVAANTPSGTNPYATIADLPSGSDYTFTTLVAPVIAPQWAFESSGGGSYTPSSSTAHTVTVDIGTGVVLNAVYQYPTPDSGQSAPTSASGDWGSTPPPAPNSNSVNINRTPSVNTTYTVVLSKPKTGLIVVGSQVVEATGNDTTTDSISVAFSYKTFYGTTTKDGSTQPILDADILALTSQFATSRALSLTNFGGGATRIVVGIPTSFGTASFIVNGLSNTAFTKVRSASSFVNAANTTIQLDVYVSNNIYNSSLNTFQVT